MLGIGFEMGQDVTGARVGLTEGLEEGEDVTGAFVRLGII